MTDWDYEAERGPAAVVYWFLVIVFFLVAIAAGYFLYSSDMGALQTIIDPGAQHLRMTNQVQPDPVIYEIPVWLWILVAVIFLAQIFPLVIAHKKAQKRPLSKRELRVITCLCETPIYLGLLGSLLGVCLTQFLTGNLTAPLAYLTTISGILAYLFARLTIWVSLPDDPEA